MATIACFVSAPITAFRAPRAREYLETLPVPPPATVYGMLLSAVGQENRLAQRGAELAVAIITPGMRTRVLRTMWRVKDARLEPGIDQNKRPDFQEILIGVRLAVHVRASSDEAAPSLAEQLDRAFQDPASIHRYGGLSLGESAFLVDELRPLRRDDVVDDKVPGWLVQDPDGPLALPIWPDHVGSEYTRYGQFNVRRAIDLFQPPAEAWVRLTPAA